MAHDIGIVITDRITVGAVSGNALVGSLRAYPEETSISNSLYGVPAEHLVQRIVDLVQQLGIGEDPSSIGLGMPGIVRNGVVEDSPNLVQFKGIHMQNLVTDAFGRIFGNPRVSIFNDADVMAAGIAAIRGHLDRLVRVWTLGTGIGFGRYPSRDGVWEAGHSVVTLDPKEQFCGCGGKGHLEGIMGHRAMRLRFMDLEPDEIFSEAEAGDSRCVDFVKLWHRALAAATATSIHLDGPGKFFITGTNARFLNLGLLNEYLHEMVKLSPLQGYSAEIVPGGEMVATIGAAVNASQATG
ncbi:MAG: ROK family protein [Acidobacteriaceae bacterium]|nr:ROK family protein [Acidobacteriaceae bacterium]MBV9502689.1 ROK family protein [Acidobacteriaceae bacterium]